MKLDVAKKVAIVLPHCDDEFFISPLFEILEDTEFHLFFVTQGSAYQGDLESTRRVETQNFLKRFSKNKITLHFYDKIKDGNLSYTLDQAYNWLIDLMTRDKFDILLSPDYEAGHHDHDASFILAKKIAKACRSYHLTFSLYNSRSTPFFRVMDSKDSVDNYKFSLRIAIKVLMGILCYKSQRITFMGLLPGILKQFLIFRSVCIKNRSNIDIQVPPHEGRLLIEKRFKKDFKNQVELFQKFLES